jgi:hypothetical protein
VSLGGHWCSPDRSTDHHWELLLPEEAKRLPAELAHIDAYLDDVCFLAPWRALFDRRLGRPSAPVDTLLRLPDLKHRYGLGYEGLCREVADSIGWRRFCRLGLDQPVPHPATLVKLVRRAGPEVIEQPNKALVAKLAADKLLQASAFNRPGALAWLLVGHCQQLAVASRGRRHRCLGNHRPGSGGHDRSGVGVLVGVDPTGELGGVCQHGHGLTPCPDVDVDGIGPGRSTAGL